MIIAREFLPIWVEKNLPTLAGIPPTKLAKLSMPLTENKGDIKKAIKFAKKLDNNSLTKPNPSTGIYLFAEYFLAYLS